jgi:uncharacterized membrane protein
MMGFALMTGLAAFVGVRLALRHHYGGGCGRRRRFWHQHRHWGGWTGPELEDDGDPMDFSAHPSRWHRGGSVVMRAVMDRIGARPDQQQTIRAAFDELKDAVGPLRSEGRHTREEIASAMRKPVFDEVLFGELFARHDSAIERLRKAVMGALAKTHDALDDRQRERLGDIIAEGPRAFRRSRW